MNIYQPVISGSLTVTGSSTFIGGITLISGSVSGTASLASTASSADVFLVRNNLTSSNALVTGTLTAQTLVVQTITSSIEYSSGSNIFGSLLTNTQTFTGSVNITGSQTIAGNIKVVDNPGISYIGFGAGGTSLKYSYITSTTEGAQKVGLAIYTTSDAGATNQERIRINDTGSVGIGRTNPEFTLDVNGDIALNRTNKLMFAGPTAGDRSRSYFTGDGLNSIYLYGPSSNVIMTWAYTGVVGIGSTSPTLMLDVAGQNGQFGSSTAYRTARFVSTAAAVTDKPGIILGYDTSGAGVIAAATEATGQPIAFWTYNGSSWSEKMRILSNGRVGIGTTNPADKLHVSNGGAEGIEFGFDTGQPYFFSFNRNTSTSLPLKINQTGAGGNVLVGGATDYGQKFQSKGTVNIYSNNTSIQTTTKTASSGTGMDFYMGTDYAQGTNGDNIAGLVIIAISEASTNVALGNAVYIGSIINPRGGGGTLTQISKVLGGGVSALSLSMTGGGNTITVNATLTSGATYRATLTFIGGGGTS